MILLNISKRPCSTCNVCATPSQAFALTGILRFLLLRIATNLSGREGEENVSGRVGLGWVGGIENRERVRESSGSGGLHFAEVSSNTRRTAQIGSPRT